MKRVCFDCPFYSVIHYTQDGDTAYVCTAVTTGNGGTTHPVIGYWNDGSVKELGECLFDNEED